MASFQAPADAASVPSVLPSTRGVQYRLFRYYRARPAGRNVFIYSNNVVSEQAPDGSTTFWLPSQGSPYVSHVFWGGHEAEEITDAEANLLTAAGYEVIP